MFTTRLNGPFGTAGRKRKKILRTAFTILLLLFFPGMVQVAQSHPPLVPEGEKLEKPFDLINNISIKSNVHTVSFSPDGKRFASGSSDAKIHLWDTASGKRVKVFEGHENSVLSVTFSPGGEILASGSSDKNIRLWDAASGKEIKTLHGHEDNVNSVVFSPDGKTLASGSSDKTIRLWDVASGKEIKTLQGHTGWVNSVVFSPDGKTLASCSHDTTIRLWDVAAGKEIKTLHGNTRPVYSVVFSPDGKILASGSWDETIRLWDVAAGKEIKTLQGHTNSVTSVVFSPDGKILASGSWDHTIHLCDAASGKKIKTLHGHTDFVNSVIFNPDGKILASGAWHGTIHLCDAASGKEIKTLHVHTDHVNHVVFSPDGKTLASGSDDYTIRLWDVASGKEMKTLQGHTSFVKSVVFSPDGKILASGSWDNTIRLWDVASGKVIKTLRGHANYVNSVVFSPDGKTLASGSYDSTIRLWDVASGNEIRTLQGHRGGVSSVVFSPDGKTLASGYNDTAIRLWDVASGKVIKTLRGHRGGVSFVVFSPDGKTLASGSWEIMLHRVEDGKRLWIFIGGSKENWLAINSQNRIWRGDDGTLLVKKDKNGNLSPVPPPKPRENGKLTLIEQPASLVTYDGESTGFKLKLKNIGKGRIYWINAAQDMKEKPITPLVFHPPLAKIILEPGDIVEMPCRVSALSRYANPIGGESKLYLEITAAYSDPLNLEIAVTSYTPRLELEQARLQKQDKNILLVSIKNAGKQSILNETEFVAKVHETVLAKVTQPKIETGDSTDIPFSIPDEMEIDKNSKLYLEAKNMSYPVHEWEFKDQPIILPAPVWYWYVLFGFLLLASTIGIYYLRIYMHPLTRQLSKEPAAILNLAPRELKQARYLLKQTRGLAAVLSSMSINKSRLDQAIAFSRNWGPGKKCQYLAGLFGAICKPEPGMENKTYLFKLRMSPEFMLNMEQCLLAFPPGDMPAHEVINQVKKIQGAFYQVCLFITFNEQQQAELRKTSLNLDNLFVTPHSKELTHLLLSPSPLDVFARLIASQVKVTRISPYQTKGGVKKESIFFGRVQLLTHIMQREPANYLLVGGRQLGKSSLLKAIERRYNDDPNIECHYLHLQSSEITGLLAGSLDLQGDTNLQELLNHLRQSPGGKHRLFLIDEADRFIASEAQTGCAILQHFRSLSEEGQCYFIFAGFWNLYNAATFEYQSPIKNFGEILQIEALEPDACRQLATKPMSLLNIHYESDELVEILLKETGQRPNLIAIICNEMLKKLDMTQRLIHREHLEEAMDSNEVRSSLSGWERLTSDETSNRMDRIIVYATINQETFTQAKLMRILDSHGCSYEPEAIKQSLARLELAFILKRRKQGYFYCVPLFKKIVQQQDPEDLLNRELKKLKGDQR